MDIDIDKFDEHGEIYFKVTVSVRTTEKECTIGPYRKDELNEYGRPKDKQQFKTAVWEMVDAWMEPISREEASRRGFYVAQ